jgi:hypothetical protein
MSSEDRDLIENCKYVFNQLPAGGLFAGHNWLISPEPFFISPQLYSELLKLGRVLLQFYKACNLLYYFSITGRSPRWVSEYLEKGKPDNIIEIQRKTVFKSELPRVIRPDLLLTDNGIVLTELDSVPGGIGLTAWFNKTYSGIPGKKWNVVGAPDDMIEGFSSIFENRPSVKILVSEESSTYLPEMKWIAAQISANYSVHGTDYNEFNNSDAVYRFFELFDYKNIKCFELLVNKALKKEIFVTPPLKSFLEEKMLFAFFWNRNLRDFWKRELGEAFYNYLIKIIPYTWILDPSPIPPHAAIPRLEITEWNQLKTFSQKQRQLILKISGFSELAWGARGVYLGSDMSGDDWEKAIDFALKNIDKNPFILQEYIKPRRVNAAGYNPYSNKIVRFEGRVKLCPYYFVTGDWNNARSNLSGILATICPADKKIIHGMRDAVLAPCAIAENPSL